VTNQQEPAVAERNTGKPRGVALSGAPRVAAANARAQAKLGAERSKLSARHGPSVGVKRSVKGTKLSRSATSKSIAAVKAARTRSRKK
jgi:hypothetical protein